MILLESLLFSFNLEQQPSEQRWKQPFKGRQNFHQHISVLSVGIRKLKHQAQSILKTNLIFLEEFQIYKKKEVVFYKELVPFIPHPASHY